MTDAVPAVLLFDLGGVLIEHTTFQELPALLPEPIETASLYDRWLTSDSVRRFESGQMMADEFSVAFASEWGLTISPEAFLAAFSGWPKGPYVGAIELLGALRERFTIAFLSNCNPIHWERLGDIIGHADRAFSSHHFGIVKPDAEIFERVITELDCQPRQICFFDDSLRNVEAARASGMKAHQTVGFAALRSTIASLGYL
jgi:glucose-1-phosphatase